MPTIEHFEIPADNLERAKKFYEGLLGWEIKDSGVPGVKYWIIQTKDLSGKPGLRGGMLQRENPGHLPVNYVSVADIEHSVQRAQALGGKVLHRSEQPGVGKFAILHDTEGNMIALWQKPDTKN